MVIDAVKEVGGPSFFALLVIAVSFLPVLTLEAQEGRLFKPLAYTKNFSMIIAAVLAITLDPAMRLLFTHMKNFEFRPRWLARAANAVLVGKIHSEENHPISRSLIRLYEPVCAWSLRWKWFVIAGAVALVIVTVPVFERLGSEFMPPLDEGSLLYMPSTLPGISVTEAQQLLQVQDRIIKRFPEVRNGARQGRPRRDLHRSGAALDDGNRHRAEARGRSGARSTPGIPPGRPNGPSRSSAASRPTTSRTDQLVDEMNEALKLPGVSNAWTMPIKARIDMLTTGIRTPVGIKIYGADIKKIEEHRHADRGAAAEGAGHAQRLRRAHRRRLLPRFQMEPRRAGPLRLSASTTRNDVVMSAIGGENVTTTSKAASATR